MSLTLHVPESRDLKPRLTVFGVGGAGGNAVNNMIVRNLDGVEFVVANTDAQALNISESHSKIQLGEELTEGLGAGAKPEVGARAAEESLDKITDFLMGSHMCFITAGMGGGTGTGAAPIIAQAARQMGILTVGVVTKPFHFEGSRRMVQAESGIEELQKYVDTLIVIPNQNLFRIASEKTTFTEAFGLADDVLYQGVKGVTDLMVRPGLVNLDFADIRSVMDEMGKAMMGTGEADGEDRALQAAENAIANPLLDEISLQGARGVLINITGGDDMTLHEVDEASNKIRNEVDPEANIIFGSTYDPELTGRIRVSVVATGIDAEQQDRANMRASTKSVSAVSAPASQGDADDLFSSQNVVVEAPRSHVERAQVEEVVMVEAPQAESNVSAAFDAGEQAAAPQGYEATSASSVDDYREVEAQHTLFDGEYDAPEAAAQSGYAENVSMISEAQDDDLEARRDAARQRMQEAARAEPATAPRPKQDLTPPSRGRFGIDSMIKKMSGHEEPETKLASTSRPEPSRDMLPPRRAPQANARTRMDDGDRQRVDIPAFLRRKAN